MIQNMSKPRRVSTETRREVRDRGGVWPATPLVAVAGAMMALLVTFRGAKVGADQLVFAAGVEKTVGESGMSADLSGENLRAGSWFENGWRSICANEFAFFGKDEQLISGERERCSAKIVLSPAN